ncbi:phage tail assembly protein T [Phytopseudomonas flavescens]|uniref:phage tail assembly protein T n=1 Tax=Phytopseudomonas flavescens TaxID=29435 RepID=UPI000A0229F3
MAEAKERLSYPEFLSWIRFRNTRGTLHLGMRVDRGAALLATLYANLRIKEGGYSVADFMPFAEQREPTVEDAMAAWG